MTHDPLDAFFRQAREEHLTQEEKSSMRHLLSRHAQLNPIQPRGINRNTFSISRIGEGMKNLSLAQSVSFALLFFTLIGASTTYAAKDSLPGMALYRIKRSVIEPVRVALAASPLERAKIHIALAESRLSEVEQLAVKGALTPEIRDDAERNFKKHTQNAKVNVAKIGEKEDTTSATEIGLNFEATLKAHGRVLAKLGEESQPADLKEALTAISAQVANEGEAIAGARMTDELQLYSSDSDDRPAIQEPISKTKLSTEKAMYAAEKKEKEAQQFITEIKGSLTDSTYADVLARMNLARSAMAQGKLKLSSGMFAEAFVDFQKSIRIAEEARVSAGIWSRLQFTPPPRPPELEDMKPPAILPFPPKETSTTSPAETPTTTPTDLPL